jgi:outer membrane protein assembly factor BamB
MTVTRCTLIAATVIAGLVSVSEAQSPSGDWLQWRGAYRDVVIAAFSAPAQWPEKLVQRWKAEVGLGYATPLVAGNRVYLFSRLGENETMSAIDAGTGKVLWQTGYAAPFTMHSAAVPHGQGPKSTPTLANGKLYAIGMTGVVTAFDAATGKQLWQKPGSKVVPVYTSHAFSPLIDGGLVIFHVGGHNEGALTAFDLNTGDVKWSWKGDGPGYGSPIIANLGGTRQIVTITQGKLIGVDPATGELLWERPFVSGNNTNAVTPTLFGQTVIVSGNGDPTHAVRVSRQNSKWTTEKVWENADVPLRFSNGVVAGNRFFSLSTRNSGQYFSLDAATGKTLWVSEPRQAGNAAIATAGDLIFSLEDDGELVVLRNSATAFEPLRRYKVAETQTWTQPAISGNRIFVKDVSSLTLWTLN